MFIDKQSPIPAYYQLKNYVLEQIKSGNWKKDNAIPSERELSKLAKVSRMTVRQAINELVNDNILYKIQGKGTYITKSKIEQKNIMSFSQMVKNKGLTASTKILSFKKSYISHKISDLLGLQPNTKLYAIERLRIAGGTPIGIEQVFIPEDYCRGMEEHDLTGSLYNVLLHNYQYKIDKLDVCMEAVLPNENETKLLKIDTQIPLLKVSGTSITNTGLHILYEISLYRSDKMSYKVNIYNRKTF